MKDERNHFIPHPSYFQKGGIDLNSPLERGPGVCFLLGKLFNYKSLARVFIHPKRKRLKCESKLKNYVLIFYLTI